MRLSMINQYGLAMALMAYLALVMLVGTANAHPMPYPHSHDYPYSSATDAKFWQADLSSQSLSIDQETLTVTLPPASTITSDTGELVAKILPTWNGTNFPLDNGELVADPQGPYANKVRCWSQITNQSTRDILCKLDSTFAAGLRNDLTIQMYVKGNAAAPNGSGSFPLKWTFKPTPGGPYVDSLTAGTITKGQLANLRVTLTDDAPSGGVAIRWKLVPANCFEQASGSGVSYAASGALNDLTINSGNKWRDFSVQSVGCTSSSAKFETWVENTNTNSPPYYVARSFTLLTPEDDQKSLTNRGSGDGSKGKSSTQLKKKPSSQTRSDISKKGSSAPKGR